MANPLVIPASTPYTEKEIAVLVQAMLQKKERQMQSTNVR